MERRRLCWCFLVALLAALEPGAAITRQGGDINVLHSLGEQSPEQVQWQHQDQSNEERPEQEQKPTQWFGQQVQGPAQWPGQNSQGSEQWPGQQSQYPNRRPGEQPQGQQQWHGHQVQQPSGEWSQQNGVWNQEHWSGQQQVPGRYPAQTEQNGQIEQQTWGVAPTGDPRPSAPWEWEPVKGGKLPAGEAKQPVVQQPPAGAAELQRVLADSRFRWPLTVAVDTDPESLHHTRRYWMGVDEGTLPDNRFDLVTFNDTQASGARQVQGVATLQRALSMLGDSASSAQGAAFLALLQASQRAPRDSAVLLFTGRPSAVDSYASLASQELLKKGCRLYVWWSGERRFGGSGAERLYRDAAQHTGGAFYQDASATDYPYPGSDFANKQPTNMPPHSSPWKQHEFTQVILAARQGLHGVTSTPVMVDSTVGELHVIILGIIKYATIRTPSGGVIDLLRESGEAQDAATAAAAGHTDATGGLLERQFNTSGERPGQWELSVSDRGGSTGAAYDGYDVIVKGSSVLRVGLRRPGSAPAPAHATTDEDGDLVVTIHGGPRTNITGLELLDEKGNSLRKTHYKQRVRRDEYNREVIELTVPQQALQLQQQPMPHYVRVNGNNGSPGGEAFTRITPQISTTGSLIVTLNAASNLTIQPGTQSQIYLDIINNASRPSRIYVYGSSSRNILYRINPSSSTLNANQRMTVSLHLYPPANMNGVEDLMKVQVYGDLSISELFLQTNIANYIYDSRDTARPSLKYRILNNCKEIQSCSSKQWNMEATVQDNGSGIREISSVPQGIIWSPMVIGTKMPVTIKYRASCCDESVVINVSDIQHNTARYTINVNEESTGLSPGAIAGIVIGAIVVLIIIIVIIVLLCKKKKTTHTFQTQQVAR